MEHNSPQAVHILRQINSIHNFPNYFFNIKGNTYRRVCPGLPVNLFHSDFVYAQYISYEAGVNTSSDFWEFSSCTAMTLFRGFGEMYLVVTEFRSRRS